MHLRPLPAFFCAFHKKLALFLHVTAPGKGINTFCDKLHSCSHKWVSIALANELHHRLPFSSSLQRSKLLWIGILDWGTLDHCQLFCIFHRKLALFFFYMWQPLLYITCNGGWYRVIWRHVKGMYIWPTNNSSCLLHDVSAEEGKYVIFFFDIRSWFHHHF